MRPTLLALVAVLAATGAAIAQSPVSPAAGEITPALRAACEGDYKRLCAGVQPGGGRILQCLKTHGNEVSEGCRTALSEHRP